MDLARLARYEQFLVMKEPMIMTSIGNRVNMTGGSQAVVTIYNPQSTLRIIAEL